MFKRLSVISIICVLLVGLVSTASAQTGDISLQVDEARIDGFPEVAVAVTVRDANGVPVPGLDASNFELLEATIDQPRTITGVTTRVNPDAQVSVILVLDISNSMSGDKIAALQSAARQFIAQMGDNDLTAVLAFADSVDFDAPDALRERDFTADQAQLLNLIDALEASGSTPLYDALFKAVGLADRADLGHRAVLLLTDGVDEGINPNQPGSRVASADTPIQAAQQANIPIFTIGLGPDADRGYLERVARTTGGGFQFAPGSAELQATFQNVAERLKQQYVVTYASGYDCDGLVHRVEIDVENNGRSADGDFELGPLPENPGCNAQAVATVTPSVSAETEATETAVPTATATPQLPTETPVPTQTPEPMPTETSVVVDNDATTEQGDSAETDDTTLDLGLIIGGALAALFVLLFAWAWRRRSRATDFDQ